jgi:hypothetical protein
MPYMEVRVQNLGLLMDYTKFHIGLYITLFSAIAAVLTAANGQWLRALPAASLLGLRIGAVSLIVAGAAGGIIGSSIPEAPDWKTFRQTPLGPAWVENPIWAYDRWAAIEHGAFWITIVVVAASLILPGFLPLLRRIAASVQGAAPVHRADGERPAGSGS